MKNHLHKSFSLKYETFKRYCNVLAHANNYSVRNLPLFNNYRI